MLLEWYTWHRDLDSAGWAFAKRWVLWVWFCHGEPMANWTSTTSNNLKFGCFKHDMFITMGAFRAFTFRLEDRCWSVVWWMRSLMPHAAALPSWTNLWAWLKKSPDGKLDHDVIWYLWMFGGKHGVSSYFYLCLMSKCTTSHQPVDVCSGQRVREMKPQQLSNLVWGGGKWRLPTKSYSMDSLKFMVSHGNIPGFVEGDSSHWINPSLRCLRIFSRCLQQIQVYRSRLADLPQVSSACDQQTDEVNQLVAVNCRLCHPKCCGWTLAPSASCRVCSKGRSDVVKWWFLVDLFISPGLTVWSPELVHGQVLSRQLPSGTVTSCFVRHPETAWAYATLMVPHVELLDAVRHGPWHQCVSLLAVVLRCFWGTTCPWKIWK